MIDHGITIEGGGGERLIGSPSYSPFLSLSGYHMIGPRKKLKGGRFTSDKKVKVDVWPYSLTNPRA